MSGVPKPRADPGWNDPPTLNYNASNPPPKSRIGNKRIAFPLSGNQSSNTNSPAKLNDTLPIPGTLPPSTNTDDLLKRLTENIDKILNDVNDSNGMIKSKVDIMMEMWKEGKFNTKMQDRISDMGKYLAEGNLEKVNECHLQLMMENSEICNSWIGAFTQIITSLSK